MKLIYCNECHDLVLLVPYPRRCLCGKSCGMYITVEHALILGPCTPIGISNPSLAMGLHRQTVFAGFVYGAEVPHNGSVIRVD